jgi:tetratricopeptide (TPR) repeat protein
VLAAVIATFGFLSIVPAASAQQDLRPVANANVIVFDNDYLDQRFGQSRAREISRTENIGFSIERKTGHAVSDFFGAGFLQIVPNGSLLKGITRGTSPRRAAALRLAESGRRAVQNKQTQRAIYYLEKALGIEASPFVHFYLARAHYQLADYQRSRQFLEVAESAFDGHDSWLAELAALRRALSAASPGERSNTRLAGERSGR